MNTDRTRISEHWQHDPRYFYFTRNTGLPRDTFEPESKLSQDVYVFWAIAILGAVAVLIVNYCNS